MRILVLNYEFPPVGGGGGAACLELCRGYAERGHQVTVVTMRHHGLPARETRDGLEIHRVPSYRQRKDLCRTAEMATYLCGGAWFLETHLRTRRYDACHAHFLLPTGPLAWWVRRRFGLPYVVTAHGSDVPGFNPDRFTRLHRLTPPLLRAVLRGAAAVVSPSRYLLGLMERALGPCEARVLPNGIHPDRLQPGAKRPLVLGCGRFQPRKGFQHLVEAVRHEPLECEVHLCGDGPLKEELERMARTSRTPVYVHGWLPNDSPAYRRLLAEASIFVLPSGDENASMALLEAMLAGCAVVTSDRGGAPETVGPAGITLDATDPRALRGALQRLLGDGPEREARAAAARHRALHDFDWGRIVEGYLDLLREARVGPKVEVR